MVLHSKNGEKYIVQDLQDVIEVVRYECGEEISEYIEEIIDSERGKNVEAVEDKLESIHDRMEELVDDWVKECRRELHKQPI